MKIGITYDLRQDYLDEGYGLEETAEFDKPDTIEAIENTLKELGYETERIGNVKKLVKALAEGKKWDLVFNIAEGMYGLARESQIPSLLDAYQIPYTFSDSFLLSMCLHKGVTKAMVQKLGINTPDFFVVENEKDIDKVNLSYPLFVKPVAEGTSKGITALSKITDKKQLEETCKYVLETFNQPALVEEFLPGREFTVGIVGSADKAKAIGVLEIILNKPSEYESYSYETKANYEDLVTYTIVDDKIAQECKELALKVWRGLGCRDAGRVDIRVDKNNIPSFIEVNPLAGLNPSISDLPIMCSKIGFSYKDLMDSIVKSALERVNDAK